MKYPLKFRAAILEKQNTPLVIDEVEFEGPLLPGQILVKVILSGVCGKQIEEIKGSAGPDKFLPHMLGHEGVGRVVDCGPGVTKVKGNELVVLHWLKGMGIDAATPLYNRNGVRVNAGWVTTFNEYAVVAENRITVIPEQSDLVAACLMGCAGMTGIGVVYNEANVRPGESVAIVGCGGVGLCSVAAAAAICADPILAVDVNPAALERARECGATNLYNPNSNKLDRILDSTPNTEGYSKTIVTVGDPKALEFAATITAHPGEIYLVAVPPAGAKVELDALAIHRQRSFNGSCGGGAKPERDIGRYLGLIERGKVKLNGIIGKTVTLDELNQGIEQMLSGDPGRVILSFG